MLLSATLLARRFELGSLAKVFSAYGRTPVKTLVSIIVFALALAVTAPVFARGVVTKATTKDACDKAGGVWNATTNKCKSRM